MAVLLDGKRVSAEILQELKGKVAAFPENARRPGLAVILAGNDPASAIYVANKEKTAKELGYNSSVIRLSENVDADALLEIINKLNQDAAVDAILLQLPLPKHLGAACCLQEIAPDKDVDGFHPINVWKLSTNTFGSTVPCTPKGIVELLSRYDISVAGKNVVIAGRSNIVGKPLAQLLLNLDATVTVAHSKTRDLPAITRGADILVSAVGRKNLITKDMVKKGAIVVDVGILRDENGKLCGDVDFENVKEVASYITPVPGGVGPMTIAMLLQNLLEAATQIA
jgi:methylenetetrahydrofolate dehydrogenase (NADP+)/methenyltetrahydrofolate cyclohydrolase